MHVRLPDPWSGTMIERGPTMTSYAYVVRFAEGGMEQRNLLGGKGANLAEMTRMGLPVPPGFVVTTEACRRYLATAGQVPGELWAEISDALAELEATVGRRLGDALAPLLLSVRSGAPFSMPGMMDTVLNLGLNEGTVEGIALATGDARFAHDAHRRFVQLYGKVVMGVDGDRFERALAELVAERGAGDETGLDAADLAGLAATFMAIVAEDAGAPVPEDPVEQLQLAVEAVFRSWNGRRARDYRRLEGIPDDLGTAVTVQTMVFGNLGPDSGSGVAFTRNPATGEAAPYGDWLPRAQGEDVVAGTRVTRHLDELAETFPACAAELDGVMRRLEAHYRDLCDIEFTIEDGRLYVLQTRVGKRTAAAALRMAVDMVAEGLIDEREAVLRVSPAQLEQLLHPHFAPGARPAPLVTGLAASPGAAVGAVCFDSDEAERLAAAGTDVVLVRSETSPDDLHGMVAARGILTCRGGLVSHAAVVARGMGKPAVCGAEQVRIDEDAGTFAVGDTVVRAGDVISLDGTTGEVFPGAMPLVVPAPGPAFATVLGWADKFRTLGVRANADLPADAAHARELGAEGIGLCRTEHMFLGDRLPVVQRMILAAGGAEEEAALAELLGVQRADFRALLAAMDGLPVTVRLLDPPLHEFLPDVGELLVAQARGGLDAAGRRLLAAARLWDEENPMLGTRGCRLGILKPNLYRMQTRALLEAAVELALDGGDPRVEIMIPLVAAAGELELVARWVEEAAEEVLSRAGTRVAYRIGTMIETPRAALVAGALARTATFFSFGTNDLTQMAYGFSRDDVEARVMPTYLAAGVLPANPFSTLDAEGVGRLMEMACVQGRASRRDLHVGACGEHAGDAASIRLCHDLGLDYVSCSPFRVPVARLAAAHAALGAAGPATTA